MKILLLTHEFPPVGGGGGRVALDIASGLATRGFETHVLTAHFADLPQEENRDGLHIYRVGNKRREAFRATFADMAYYNWAAVIKGLKLIRTWRPDVIHAHFAVPAGAAALVLSQLTGIPYILTTHLGDVPGAVPEKTENWFKWIYTLTPFIWRKALKIVASSSFTRKLALQHYPVEIRVIPSAVDLSALPTHQPSDGAPRIIFAARFVMQKNPEHLVAALSALKDLPWVCTMIGDGPLLEPVIKAVAAHGLSERFSFPGWVLPKDLLKCFAQSDILVMPSRSEGLSVVGVQSLGMGLAMILSDVGGNSDLVQHGENGFLFPSGDVEALTSALRQLLENRALLQSAQAKSRELAQAFDLPNVIKQYETLFTEIGPLNRQETFK